MSLLLGWDLSLFLEESKELFPKKNFRGVGVDVGKGNPLSVDVPDSSRDEAVEVSRLRSARLPCPGKPPA